MTFDGKAFGEEIVAAVKSHVSNVVDPILRRLDAIEARKPERGEKGDAGLNGSDGKSVSIDDVAPLIRNQITVVAGDVTRMLPEMIEAAMKVLPPVEPKEVEIEVVRGVVAEAMAAVPKPENGKDADPAEVKRLVDEAVAALPPAQNGKDADPEQVATLVRSEAERILATWDRPQDGKSVTAEEVAPLIDESVQRAVAALPVPKDGAPGRDGVGVAGGMIDRDGDLHLTLSNGEVKNLGTVVGRNGEDGKPGLDGTDGTAGLNGKDGADGVGFDDMTCEVRDDGVYLVWEKDAVAKEARLPIPMDRGVWKDGVYRSGDGVTWAGSFWIAQEETSEKPDGGKGWRLAVKKGRDGRDGVVKEAKPAGPVKV